MYCNPNRLIYSTGKTQNETRLLKQLIAACEFVGINLIVFLIGYKQLVNVKPHQPDIKLNSFDKLSCTYTQWEHTTESLWSVTIY